jgi:formiminoglutamate deiminase
MAGTGPVHIHAAEQEQEVKDCVAALGARPVEWLLDHQDINSQWCLVHATHMTDKEASELARSGAVAGLCPITEANLGDGLFNLAPFAGSGGRWGVGSDSNVLINAAEELRLLEYGQRLKERRRAVFASAPGHSTGEDLFQAAISGGAHAVGVACGLIPGASADLVSFDRSHPSLAATTHGDLLDRIIFAGGAGAIDCVWRHGRKVVEKGRHREREVVEGAYRATLTRVLAH